MSKVLSCHSQPDLFYYFNSPKYWQWKFLALFTATADLHSSLLLRSKSKSGTLKISIDTNDLGVWGKKKYKHTTKHIPGHEEEQIQKWKALDIVWNAVKQEERLCSGLLEQPLLWTVWYPPVLLLSLSDGLARAEVKNNSKEISEMETL